MSSFRSDPLLGVTRGLLVFVMACLAFAAAACLIALPLVLLMQDRLMFVVAHHMPAMAHPGFPLALAGLLVAALVLLATMWVFTRNLRRIVDSVATGDPFIPENAVRLRQMAWLAIANQVIGMPIHLFGAMMHDRTHHEMSFSLNGVLLPLVLFILARVFRTGAAMREELEGTV